MAYQPGVANSMSDLISALQAFAIANAGFAAGTSWSYSSGGNSYTSSTITKNGVNYGFDVPSGSNTDKSFLYVNSFVGTPTTSGIGAAHPNQPNACSYSKRIGNMAGPFVSYNFFSDGIAVHAAVEIVTSVFAHINFGEISQIGSWTGGQFVTGGPDVNNGVTLNDYFNAWSDMPFCSSTYGNNNFVNYGSSGHVRVPTLGPTAAMGRSNTTTTAINSAMVDGVGRYLLNRNPNSSNGRAVLVPIHLHQSASGGSGPWMHLGFVSNARFVNIKNLNPKDIVNTNWMVFPVSQKNGPASVYANSGNYGLAYQK